MSVCIAGTRMVASRADLKWYPPELHADYVAPLSPPPPLPPPPKLPPPPTSPAPGRHAQSATRHDEGSIWPKQIGIVLVGLTLLAIAVMAVAVLIGAKASGLFAVVVAWAIVIIGVTIVVRSDLPAHAKSCSVSLSSSQCKRGVG